jgi:hypothetical protein
MKIVEMPIEWQQRSANTFSVPMPVRETAYSQHEPQVHEVNNDNQSDSIRPNDIHPAGAAPENSPSKDQ